ncbi:hypothetical protein BH10PSE17_BH10PSE17_29600 [soil metagenome]
MRLPLQPGRIAARQLSRKGLVLSVRRGVRYQGV